MKKSFYLVILLLSILITSCEIEGAYNEEGIYDREGVYENTQLIEKLNSEAVETLIIGGNSFVLEAYLWRDFMPVSSSDGNLLISINWLTDINSVKIPDNIRMLQQYVIYGGSIWIANYENEASPNQLVYRIEKVSRNGPQWGPKVYVDVISKVRDSKTDKIHYIKCKNAYIERTD